MALFGSEKIFFIIKWVSFKALLRIFIVNSNNNQNNNPESHGNAM